MHTEQRCYESMSNGVAMKKYDDENTPQSENGYHETCRTPPSDKDSNGKETPNGCRIWIIDTDTDPLTPFGMIGIFVINKLTTDGRHALRSTLLPFCMSKWFIEKSQAMNGLPGEKYEGGYFWGDERGNTVCVGTICVWIQLPGGCMFSRSNTYDSKHEQMHINVHSGMNESTEFIPHSCMFG